MKPTMANLRKTAKMMNDPTSLQALYDLAEFYIAGAKDGARSPGKLDDLLLDARSAQQEVMDRLRELRG